ncbi:Uncharacterized protein GBIM_15822 [Gryllus bimaculatus]|nr:Uncharacterized protein GBIM_15822 [Gryllus bimaculatus]
MSDKVDDELVKIFEDGLRLNSDKEISKCSAIPSNLAGLECPFTWKFDCKCDVPDIVDRIEGKLDEMDDDDEELIPWKSFVLNLILCYEYSKNGDLGDAEEKQSILDEILEKSLDESGSSGPVIGLGLKHISLACKCFLLHASQLYDEVDNTLTEIVPFEDLKNKDKASVISMKGACFAEFGYSGIRDSIELFEKALEIDNECGEWYFLLGRSLSRLRRLEKRSAIPDQRELKSLERAVEISNYVSFMVLLAQSYRETARNIFIEKKKELRSFKPFCDSLNQKSLELYKRVLRQDKINVHVLIRCGLGFMKLPMPWKDLDNAKTCILNALDIAPKNPMANHVAGTYYTTVKNYKLAMEYLSKACTYGVFGAEIDLIVLKSQINETYVPVADIERLLEVYKEKPHQESTLCLLGAYYHFSENNFKKAFTYWSQVIELDINSEKLKVYYDAIARCPWNINKIIVTEIMKLLNAGDVSESETTLFEQTITKYIRHHPGLIVSATDIDVSLYKTKAFEYKSWKNHSIDKKFFSGHSFKSNDPLGGRGKKNASSSNESSFFRVSGQGQFHSGPSALSDDSKASGSRNARGRERDVKGSRGRGWGRDQGRWGGAGGSDDRDRGVETERRKGGKAGELSWGTEEQPKSGTHKSNTGAVKKNFYHGAKSTTGSWRTGSN